VYERDGKLLRDIGINDSKKLSDKKRRKLFNEIVDISVQAHCEIVPVSDIRTNGLRAAWRAALLKSILIVAKNVECDVIIDGSPDPLLRSLLRTHRIRAEFQVKADVHVPAVSAASILAKTIRNDAMLKLHEQFPEYGWGTNMGYGSEEHDNALKKHGRCEQHRPYKNLLSVPDRK
jgi:ribonuclease HII